MNGSDRGVRLVGVLSARPMGEVRNHRLSDGSVYSGTVKDGKPHGVGFRRGLNGDPETCEGGEFRDGKLHGGGTRYDKDDAGGYRLQTGEWRAGVLHGWGIEVSPDGKRTEGEWCKGKLIED